MTIYFYNNNVIETFWRLDRITNSAIFTKNVKVKRKLDETEASTINSNILVPVWRNDVLEVPNWRWWRLKFRQMKNKSGKIDHTVFPTTIVPGSLEDTLQKSQGVIMGGSQACPQKWRRKKKNLLLQNSHKKRSTKALPWNLWSSENLNN